MLKELAKLAKAESENAKISIRTARKDANTEIKNSEASEDVQKNYEIDIHNLTAQFITLAEPIFCLFVYVILTLYIYNFFYPLVTFSLSYLYFIEFLFPRFSSFSLYSLSYSLISSFHTS